MIRLLAYICTIVAANVITAKTVPLTLGPFIVPWGTFLIGAIAGQYIVKTLMVALGSGASLRVNQRVAIA